MQVPETKPQYLTVLCQNQILGYVTVAQNNGHKIVGSFSPGPDYAKFQSLCELMAEWEEKQDKSSQVDYEGEIDPYWAWDKWMEAIHNLGSLGLSIPGLPQSVEELSIDKEGQIEIFITK